MIIALLKLFDIAARSLFVLVVLYTLPAASSGQFGLILTMMGLYAFVCGYERYVDIQRNVAGKSDNDTAIVFISALRLYVLNYVLWLPLLIYLSIEWIEVSYLTAALIVLVAIGEHLSNEFYRMAVISNKNKMLIFVSMIKNSCLLLLSIVLAVNERQSLNVSELFVVWAFVSMLGLLITFAIYIRRIGVSHFIGLCGKSKMDLRGQYGKSFTHFRLGLLAVLSLQADRLIAGSFLTLQEAGEYFRHLFLAMSAYQAMNVASYNKVLGPVYNSLRAGEISEAKRMVARERLVYTGLICLGLLCLIFIELIGLFQYFGVEGVELIYLVLVLSAFLLRGIADFNAMILNGLYDERKVLYSHAVTAASACLFASVFSKFFGVIGLISALNIAGAVYLICSGYFVSNSLKHASK